MMKICKTSSTIKMRIQRILSWSRAERVGELHLLGMRRVRSPTKTEKSTVK